MDVLFICHRVPYPPNKGDKIRAFHQLEYLAKRHRVRLVAVLDDPRDEAHVPVLRDLLDDVELVPLDSMSALARTGAGLLTGKSLSVSYFPGRRLGRAATRMALSRQPDVVVGISSQVVPAALAPGAPVVIDFVDKDSGKFAQYGEWFRQTSRLKSAVYRLEGKRLEAAEIRWIKRIERSLVISDYERSLFPTDVQPRIDVVRNVLHLDDFPDDRSAEEPHTIMFAGILDYFPNLDAAGWFAREVMPLVRERVADATFLVVGPKAPAELKELHGRHGVELTGFVEDINEPYRRAAISAAPFRVTQGVLNKVVEAMACRIPIVGTREAVRGLGAEEGEGITFGANPRELADRVVALMHDRDARRALGEAGRALVADRYAHPGDLPLFERIVEEAAGRRAPEVAVAGSGTS